MVKMVAFLCPLLPQNRSQVLSFTFQISTLCESIGVNDVTGCDLEGLGAGKRDLGKSNYRISSVIRRTS